MHDIHDSIDAEFDLVIPPSDHHLPPAANEDYEDYEDTQVVDEEPEDDDTDRRIEIPLSPEDIAQPNSLRDAPCLAKGSHCMVVPHAAEDPTLQVIPVTLN